MSMAAILQLALARTDAKERPRPLAAPVMTATSPERSNCTLYQLKPARSRQDGALFTRSIVSFIDGS